MRDSCQNPQVFRQKSSSWRECQHQQPSLFLSLLTILSWDGSVFVWMEEKMDQPLATPNECLLFPPHSSSTCNYHQKGQSIDRKVHKQEESGLRGRKKDIRSEVRNVCALHSVQPVVPSCCCFVVLCFVCLWHATIARDVCCFNTFRSTIKSWLRYSPSSTSVFPSHQLKANTKFKNASCNQLWAAREENSGSESEDVSKRACLSIFSYEKFTHSSPRLESEWSVAVNKKCWVCVRVRSRMSMKGRRMEVHCN